MLDVLTYGSCTVAVLFVSLSALRAMRMTAGAPWLLGVAIASAAQMVLAMEGLSLVHSIGAAGLLLVHGVSALLAAALGARSEIPTVTRNLRRWRERVLAISCPSLRILLAAVCASGLVTASLVLLLPPNNFDSMVYHMARVAYYMQQKSFDQFPTPDLRLTILPANAEILIAWQAVLLRSDRTAGLVQWMSWCGCMVAVYELARSFTPRRAREPALLAALAFVLFPQVLLQSTTTQNDLTNAFFIASAFVFGVEASRRESPWGAYLLSGMAIGLAIGTKPLALLALPGYALLVAQGFVKRGTTLRRQVAVLSLMAAATFSLGAYFYLQNLRLHGSVGGPPSIMSLISAEHPGFHVAWSTFGRIFVQALSPGGSIPLSSSLRERLTSEYRELFGLSADQSGFAPFAIHEDLSSFGPIFGCLGLPLLVLACVQRRRLDDVHVPRILALTALSYLAILCATIRWNQWMSRLLIPMVALSAPALSLVDRADSSWVSRAARALIVAISVLAAVSVCGLNEMKPLVGDRTVFGKDRIELVTWARPELAPMVRLVEGLGLRQHHVGVIYPTANEFEYPFFGKGFERTIVPILVDREELTDVRTLPAVDILLLPSESQQYFLRKGSQFATNDYSGKADLRPLLDALRKPGSGWRAMLDADRVVHLFLRDGVILDTAQNAMLPDSLPGKGIWSDRWVAKDFTALLKIDPSRPYLLLQGEMPDLVARPTLEIHGPAGEVLERLALPGPGRFEGRVSLQPLVTRFANGYAPISFASNVSFNPGKRWRSGDYRDLSWRLLQLELTPSPDYLEGFRWYSDGWVPQQFTVQVRRDPARPVLRIRGEMAPALNPAELRILHAGSVLGAFRPGRPGRFAYDVSLIPVIDGCRTEFCSVGFEANGSFNPKRAGLSEDDRDLSWRLEAIELVPKASNDSPRPQDPADTLRRELGD